MHHSRDAEAAGLSERLQPRRNVHPIAEDVLPLGNHVAEVHPNAESDALVFGRFGIALSHPALDLDRAAHGIDNARELRQQAVAGILHDPASVLPDLRID